MWTEERVAGMAGSRGRRPGAGTPAAYGAAALAFLYAAVSLYWTLGGGLLLDTVGGAVADLARRGGAGAAALGLAATALKAAGGLLALALTRRWGRPDRWVRRSAAAASVVLVAYGGLLVGVGALVLADVLQPAGVDRRALGWHVGVWDMWFLVWGVLLAVATAAHRRATAAPPRG